MYSVLYIFSIYSLYCIGCIDMPIHPAISVCRKCSCPTDQYTPVGRSCQWDGDHTVGDQLYQRCSVYGETPFTVSYKLVVFREYTIYCGFLPFCCLYILYIGECGLNTPTYRQQFIFFLYMFKLL